MVKLDPLTEAEDDKVLSEFLFDASAGFARNNKQIFSKVASIPKSTIRKVHNEWDAGNQEKGAIIHWHRKNTENTNKDFIYAIVESFEVGLLSETIEALTYAYNEGYGLSVENLYQSLELTIRDKMPIEWAVEMAVEKSAEEIADELEAEKRAEEEKRKKIENNKITLEKLQEKWDS